MRRRSLLALITLAPVATAAVACTPGAGPPAPPATELTVGATAEPPNLDPTIGDAAAIPQALLYNVYETLLRIDDAGEIQPLLATEHTVSDDRLTYTFTLDPDARFVGGRAVSADDVVWSIERVRREGSAVLKRQMEPVRSVAATDPTTVTVTLSRPSNSWLYWMTSSAGIVFDAQATGDLASTPAGSGPYAVQSWSRGTDLVLTRRDDYGRELPHFTRVTIRYFADPNAMNAAMLADQLDVISNLQAPQALDQFSDPGRFRIIEGTTQGEVVMGFNHAGVLADVRLRRALLRAVDRRALLDTVWAGKGTLIGSMVPPTDPWYADLTDVNPYDPAEARRLLAEAGWDPARRLRFRVPTLPYAVAAAQFVASQLREVGVEVTTEELEFPSRWLDQVFTRADYDLTIVAHVEPRDLVKWADPAYYWRYDDAEVQRLVAAADRGTEEQQVADLGAVARRLADQAVADFLFLLPNLLVVRAGLVGIGENATSLSFDLTTIRR